MKRNILTLENYTERYVPLVMLTTIHDCLKNFFLDKETAHRFEKRCDDLHVSLSLAITEDQGVGSIWHNIE